MGFKVTVEDSKCVQANAFIQEGLFHEFIIKEDQVTFKINLTVLLVSMISFRKFITRICKLYLHVYAKSTKLVSISSLNSLKLHILLNINI